MKGGDIVSIPHLNMHPSKLCIYNQLYYEGGIKYKSKGTKANLAVNTNRLKLSHKSNTKLTNAIDYMVHLTQTKAAHGYKKDSRFNYKLSFITLTLSSRQTISDQELAATCLNQFLTEARIKWNMVNYVWRAERQKNLNTHYHIITDVFIPWSELRNCWNRIQQKIGLIDQYRNDMKAFHSAGFKARKDLIKHWPIKAQIAAFKNGSASNWSNPNSIDIHSLKDIKSIYKYVKKYMAKGATVESLKILRRSFKHLVGEKPANTGVSAGALQWLRLQCNRARLWNCSRSLSKLKGAKDLLDSRYSEELVRLSQLQSTKRIDKEHCTLYYISFDDLVLFNCVHLLSLFSDYILQSGYYNDQPPEVFKRFSQL